MNSTSSAPSSAFAHPHAECPSHEYRVTLMASAHAVRHLRRIVRGYLRLWDMSDLADDAELAVSELAANVIAHVPRSMYMLRLLRLDGGVRVEVRDRSPELPIARTADALDESGRGLALLGALADAWGAEPTPDGLGKVVWFELWAEAG